MPKLKSGNERFVEQDLSNWSVYTPDGKPVLVQGKPQPEPKPKRSAPKPKKP